MTYYLKLYLLTIPVFIAIDMPWLGFAARSFYKKHLGYILSPEVNWPAAIAFYLMYIVGIIFFAVRPALEAESLSRALLIGAFFGFITYATYDLTNLATLKDWPLTVVIVDIAWGTVLCALVASGSYLIGRWLQ
jgi:uncharacterized membrane protein